MKLTDNIMKQLLSAKPQATLMEGLYNTVVVTAKDEQSTYEVHVNVVHYSLVPLLSPLGQGRNKNSLIVVTNGMREQMNIPMELSGLESQMNLFGLVNVVEADELRVKFEALAASSQD